MPLSDNPAGPTQIQAFADAALAAPAIDRPAGLAPLQHPPEVPQGTPEAKRARQFRPDVAGLRGIAVLLVVLFHAGLSQVSGGFVGVDVFFVISGFVITGVLLREHEKTNGTSLLAFYARRVRRILPAATVVIIFTVLISYRWLGFIAGNQVAQDDKAAALFYANFHFISLSTNYFTSRLPPSPLQHYWSLSVEEQFYFVYPSIFLCVALVWRRVPVVRKLAVVLVVVIGASLVLSVVQTASNANAAYFSPFTRAWELGLGALIAIGSKPLSKIPPVLAAALTWAGITCVMLAAFLYTSATAYPGDAVVLPVAGAAAIIAGGAAAPVLGAEALLGRLPLQWLGLISYSLYLWHWPLLVVPEEQATHPLSLEHKLLLALIAVAASVVSFLLIENPVRKAKILSRRNVLTLIMGACLIAASLSVAFVELATHS